MKAATFIIGIFLFYTICLGAAEQLSPFKMSCETICINTINDDEKYEVLDSFDSGCHKSIIRLHDYPYGKDFYFSWSRPLFKKKKDVRRRLTMSQLQDNAYMFKDSTPLFVISSRGFLPGETVSLSMMTSDGYMKSGKYEFYPHPVIAKDTADHATVTAVLDSIEPTTYTLWLSNFKKQERLVYEAVSGSEKFCREIVFNEDMGMTYNPKVGRSRGGAAVVSITRANGKKLSLPILWGEGFIPFLKGEKNVVNTDFGTLRSGEF